MVIADPRFAVQSALQFLQSGKMPQAETLCREILQTHPQNPDALNLLAAVCVQTGRFDEALHYAQAVLAIQPNHPSAGFNVGNAYLAGGKPIQAIPAYRAFLAKNPGHLGAHSNLGVALFATDRFEEAIPALQKAISINPDLVEAHYTLGSAYRKIGDWDRALISFKKVLSYMPRFRDLPTNIKPRDINEEKLAALVYKSDFAQVMNVIGCIYQEKLDYDNAMLNFKKAIELNPSSALLFNNLGVVLNKLGRFDEASDCFHKALAINPKPIYYMGLVASGRQAANPAEFERMTQLLGDPALPIEDRVNTEFALGKLLDEADRFDEAFAHFSAGNRLFKEFCAGQGMRFDHEALHEQVTRMIEDFTPSFFAGHRNWGDPSELPVFIVGMPRSSTSLVEQIAASHPAVFGAGELPKIVKIADSLPGPKNPDPFRSGISRLSPANWDAAEIAKASADHLAYLRSLRSDALRITDKMPANTFYLGLIALLFPGARVIFCRRDARDNCLSCFFARFDKNNLLFSYDLADCAHQYLESERITAHWLKTLPLRMLEMPYETLVSDQEAQSRRLIDFLGLPWDPACLKYHETKRPVLTASLWQVRQPIYTRSVGRWRHYQSHIPELLKMLDGHK